MVQQTYGVIGLGAMGAGIAINLAKAGYDVAAYDPVEAACRKAADGGVRIVGDPGVVASESTAGLISVVRTAQQNEEVLTGPGGVLGKAPARLPVIVASTIAPSVMRDLAGRLTDGGLRPVGAALSGGPWGADAGTLTFMVAGEPSTVEDVRPLFDAAGSKTVVVSERPEVALAAKLSVQLIYGVNMMGVFEALRLGSAFGIDHGDLQDILCHSVADSWIARNWDHVREWWEGDGNGLDILLKDMRAVLSEADKASLSLPTTALSFDLMRAVWPAFGSSLPPQTNPVADPVAWT